MSDAFTNTITVVMIIAISYFFKRLKFLNIDTAKGLSFVIMYLTLPCAILTSANGIAFEADLLGVILFAVAVNAVLICISFFSSSNPEHRLFNMLNINCFNIGNFVIPFMQHTLSPKAFLALCMFDIVNALFCFGGAYSISLFLNRKHFPHLNITPKTILKEMSKSLPFYIYALMIVLSTLNLSIPEEFLAPFKTIAGANTLLCMMVIGIALSFDISKEQFMRIMKVWGIRYTSCFLLALGVWFFMPFDAEIRIILMILLTAPITSLAPLFTMKALPAYTEESADLNSVAILTSVIFITVMSSVTEMLV